MKTRLAISLAAASLLASSAAFAQSTTEQGARDGARAGGDIGGPIGAMVGGTVGAAVGAGLEIPNAILGGIPRSDSVVVEERVVVGEPLPPTVVLRPVPKNQVAISSSTPRLYSQGVQIRRICGGTWLRISMATSPAPRRTACR